MILLFEFEASLSAKSLFVGLVPSLVDDITYVFSFKHFVQGDFYLKITNEWVSELKQYPMLFPEYYQGRKISNFQTDKYKEG